MTKKTRDQHLKNEQRMYRSATRKAKGETLTHLQALTGLGRKTLITKLGGDLEAKPRRKQRGRTYGPEVDDALRVIDEAYDHISAERLTPNLVGMAQDLSRHGELNATTELLEQLGGISIATIGRILKRIRQDDYRLPRGGPRGQSRTASHSDGAHPLERARAGTF